MVIRYSTRADDDRKYLSIHKWTEDDNLRLMERMMKFRLKRFDAKAGWFDEPPVYNFSYRYERDDNGNTPSSPNWVWHELDFSPRSIIVDERTARAHGGSTRYMYGGKDLPVVEMPVHFQQSYDIQEEDRRYPYRWEIRYIRGKTYLDFHLCDKIGKHADRFTGYALEPEQRRAITVALAMRKAYIDFTVLADMKHRLEMLWIGCKRAYVDKGERELRRRLYSDLDNKAGYNYWSREEVESKRRTIDREYVYVPNPAEPPIIGEIERAMESMKNFIETHRYEFTVEDDILPVFDRAYGKGRGSRILFGN